MSDILLDTQGTPTTPGVGKLIVYPDSTSKLLTTRNETGRTHSMGGAVRNWNTANVVANGADTYLTGSALVVPQHGLQVGATFEWTFVMTKTAAGIAAPVWNVRVGTAGALADTSRLSFTGPAQTGAIDTGIVVLTAVLRNTGAAGVLAAGFNMVHNLALTGFATLGTPVLQATSSGFDTTAPDLIIGVSVNPGASGVWTHQVVRAEMLNM